MGILTRAKVLFFSEIHVKKKAVVFSDSIVHFEYFILNSDFVEQPAQQTPKKFDESDRNLLN